jgi:hypothetical protein
MPPIYDLSGAFVVLSLERLTDYKPAISDWERTGVWGRSPVTNMFYRSRGSNTNSNTILEKENTGVIGYQKPLLSQKLYTQIQETEKNVFA